MDHADSADAVHHRHLDLELHRAQVVAPRGTPSSRSKAAQVFVTREGRPHRLTHSWVDSRNRRSPITTTVSSAASPTIREAPAGAVAATSSPW